VSAEPLAPSALSRHRLAQQLSKAVLGLKSCHSSRTVIAGREGYDEAVTARSGCDRFGIRVGTQSCAALEQGKILGH